MTKIHHPSNKFQRKLIDEKKHKFVNEKTTAKERDAKVWRKLKLEEAKLQETEDELHEYEVH